MIHLGEKSSFPLQQVGIARFQEPRKCDSPCADFSSSKPRKPTVMIHHSETITVDKSIITRKRQQQRSKRQRSVHIRPKDPPRSHLPPSISPLPTREGEQHHIPNENDCAHLLSSSVVCSKKVHCPAPESIDCVSSSLRPQSNASKRHWMSVVLKNATTTNSSTTPINNQEHHTTATSLFRRKAAVPSQLLKWAFDASMSLYDHLGDDDEEEEDDKDGIQYYHGNEENGGD